MSTELNAAYERIGELEQAIRHARGLLERGDYLDHDQANALLDHLDDTLANKVTK